MAEVDEILTRWGQTLCHQVPVAGLLARSAIAHKWKAMLRSVILREGVSWRTQDLLKQAHVLHQKEHTLGSRILIRSALESVAILIHLNQLTRKVLDRELGFHEFGLKTRRLLLGSRDGSTKHESINIATVFAHCEKKYEGLSTVYATLSESAHPNYEGVSIGYSEVDFDQYETNFSNRWSYMWADRHEPLVRLVCTVFQEEYNDIWPKYFEELEAWLEEHDAELEATKDGA